MLDHILAYQQIPPLLHLVDIFNQPELSKGSILLQETLNHLVADILLPLRNVVSAGHDIIPKANLNDLLYSRMINQFLHNRYVISILFRDGAISRRMPACVIPVVIGIHDAKGLLICGFFCQRNSLIFLQRRFQGRSVGAMGINSC